MLIYSNNLHEKLQGIAISRDYLKYNTPFCDIVDDPDWQLDLDIAIGYNSAINGNLSACDTLIKNLTLNSSQLDWSTLNFYVKKTKNNPIFRSSIREMQRRFNTPAAFSDSFQDALNNAFKDCLNSPCNLFLETSDSVGRMAQATSTKNGNNTFGVGTMSGSFINMIDELDQTIFNKIPALFQDGFIEVAQVANKSWTNTQAVLAGKGNISELNRLAQSGSSFRNTNTVYRYTPDVKSYYDFSAAGSMVLNKIKENMGGCFDKYQYKYRYNPYSDNTNRPIRTTAVAVNGKVIEADGAGKIHRYTDNNKNLKAQTGNVSDLPSREIAVESGEAYSGDVTTNPPKPKTSTKVEPVESPDVPTPKKAIDQPTSLTTNVGFSNPNVAISKSYQLGPRGGGVTSHYSVFGGHKDNDTRTIFYEDYAELAGDKLTLQGIGNLDKPYYIGASYFNEDLLRRALEDRDELEYETRANPLAVTSIQGQVVRRWNPQNSLRNMTVLSDTDSTRVINEGVAVSQALFRRFLNDPSVKPLSTNYKTSLQYENKFFVAVRLLKGTGKWAFFKVIDWNGQNDCNVDFTVGALKLLKQTNSGINGFSLDTPGIRDLKRSATGWKLCKKISQDDLGPMEVRICQGDINAIKASGVFEEGIDT